MRLLRNLETRLGLTHSSNLSFAAGNAQRYQDATLNSFFGMPTMDADTYNVMHRIHGVRLICLEFDPGSISRISYQLGTDGSNWYMDLPWKRGNCAQPTVVVYK